jgi:NAD(P)-dependent dehydrogenase (short-subunit alcohol dehydrogenase family)
MANLKAVVITGASSGIGRATALRLDRCGWRVFAGVRRPGDAAALRRQASNRLTPLILDVTDAGTIAAAAAIVHAVVGEAGLAGLVNNAAIAESAPLEFVPPGDVRRHLEVNAVGPVAVTQAFLPLIRQGGGRIVNVGSISGRLVLPLLGAYSASKFALEALTAALRMELAPWGIPVTLIEVGGVTTPIWKKFALAADALARRLPPQAHALYGPAITAERRRVLTSVRGRGSIGPHVVARVIVHALTTPHPRPRYVVGPRARIGEGLRLLPEPLRERAIMRFISV